MKQNMYESMFEIESYHFYFRSKHEIVMRIIEDRTKCDNSLKLIDFGCGCGKMLTYLEKLGNTTGVDFSETALEFCRKNFSGNLFKGDMQNFKTDEKYDVGVALDMLEHLDDDAAGLKNIAGALKDGALLIITVPANPSLWSSLDENCMHKRRYTKKSLEELVSNNGFKIEYISYYDFWLFPVIFLSRKLYNLLKINKDSKIENNIKDGFINNILYRIFSSEKNVISKDKTFPYGVSLICVARKKAQNEQVRTV